jgi:ribonuclease Z
VAEKRTTSDVPIRVTLLGTGAPPPAMERFGPSTLVEAGGETLLFDAGRGALQRLNQLKPPLKEVRTLFLTHLHSDHLVGLPDLWLTGWLNGRPLVPMRVWGPLGTRDMMAHLDQAFQFDIRIRLFDDRTPPRGIVVLAEDISEGLIYEKNGVNVIAFEVDHSPIYPAFGYRVEYAGKSVVISGDTRFTEHLIEYARGADVLVHEVIVPGLMGPSPAENRNTLEVLKRVIDHHTTPEQAGEIFARVQPGLAVFSHIIPVTAKASDVIPTVRKNYSGRVEMGEDLMEINVGDEITIKIGKEAEALQR